jgi:predicted RNA-binding Zn-ribbon protein involved in translation (DUF1610 family)
MSAYTYRVRSQPEYAQFQWDQGGARHLLLLTGLDDGIVALIRALPCPGPLRILAVTGACAALGQELAGGNATLEVVLSNEALIERLCILLEQSAMGLRVYAVGPEDAIWRCASAAHAAGMGRDEYQVHRAGTQARPVHCVHCGSRLPAMRTNVGACTHCGRTLLVRDHFSRHHGAYMGVQVDAECPGELPPIEEVFP